MEFDERDTSMLSEKRKHALKDFPSLHVYGPIKQSLQFYSQITFLFSWNAADVKFI